MDKEKNYYTLIYLITLYLLGFISGYFIMKSKERKAKEDELFLAIEHAIDDYIEFGGKDLTITREDLVNDYLMLD